MHESDSKRGAGFVLLNTVSLVVLVWVKLSMSQFTLTPFTLMSRSANVGRYLGHVFSRRTKDLTTSKGGVPPCLFIRALPSG
jgi:hypothetical protein